MMVEKYERDTMNVMLADDDADDRMFFQEALESTSIKHNLTLFKDGFELMDYFLDQESELPHILFLDLNMPGKSGVQCLDELRAIPRLRDMSIAIYSTSGADRDIEDTLAKGANVYIQKPSNFDKLRKVISHVLKTNWQFHMSGLNKETFFLNI
ncbi:response regulator [Flavobacterium sp.]|uniref:response regulator n=1 Tax=Flavobacterium sp. TaxID=239 RepID=UPI0025C4A9C3|nr:response regulator [Flavobacterium sp.]